MQREKASRGGPASEASLERRRRGIRAALNRKLWLAKTVLAFESLWPKLWPLAAALGLFLVFALLGLAERLPAWLHAIVLVAFALGAAMGLRRAARGLRRPSTEAARHRIETESGLTHRPLEALEDRPAGDAGDRASLALWRAHLERVATQVRRLSVGLPRTSWIQVDPWALRAPLGLLLVVALAVGGGDWRNLLARALTPRFTTAEALPPPVLDLWINPPAYTGLAPVYLNQRAAVSEEEQTATGLQSRSEGPTEIVAGSTVLAQLQGSEEAPRLEISSLAESEETEARGTSESVVFAPAGRGIFKLEHELAGGDLLRVLKGDEELAGWAITVIPDEAPTAEYLQPPGQAGRGALQIEFLTEDDFGVEEVVAEIRRPDAPAEEPIVLPMPLPGRAPTSAEGRSYNDLSAHLWAGLPVEVTLIARDAIAQEGRSEAFAMILPERFFEHPVARMLVELRKDLVRNPRERGPAISTLRLLQRTPSHFFHDIVVALALRSAERRLLYDLSPKGLRGVQQLLWDTALHIEDGDLSLAERELRDIQRRLQEALANDAPDEEIERLMNELQQALDRFLEALAEQAMEDLAEGRTEMREMPQDSQMLDRNQLQEMIDQAREMARSGARDQARDMLAQLQEMLENLQANAMNPQMSPQDQQAQEMMRGMEDLMKQQQELLDRSFERSQQGRYGEPQSGDMQMMNQRDAATQEALRRQLGEMMREFGEATGNLPRELGNAEQAMRNAREALERGAPEDAVNPQGQALDQLQQGMQAMIDELRQQQMTEGEGGESGQRSRNQEGQPDPFGRTPGRENVDSGVEIPTEMELQRSREILRELRNRRGDRSRPPVELDYLDRLLKQF